MSYLLKIIEPSLGVVINVTLEHSVYFEPFVTEVDPNEKAKKILELTATQETMLLTRLDSSEQAVVNIDDDQIAKIVPEIDAKKITISCKGNADLVGKDIHNSLARFSMSIAYQEKNYSLTIPQPLPSHFAYEFLCALGVGLFMELPIEEAISSLEKHFVLPAGRFTLFHGIKNTTIIDSTYNNATLPPILDALRVVQEIAGKKRKIAIIGDMRELGNEAEDIHKAVAKEIMQTVNFAILIGPLSEQYIAPVLSKNNFSFEDFPDVTSSKEAIIHKIQEGDVVLVKGSQNTLFMERIVELLLENKEDIQKLTRRGSFWDKQRSESL